jgi:hypothetical protein
MEKKELHLCRVLNGLCLCLSIAMLAVLYLAGGAKPYTSAPEGFHYGINSPLDAICLLLPQSAHVLTLQLLLMLRAAVAGALLCWFLQRHYNAACRLLPFLCTGYAAGVYTGCIINVVWGDAAMLLPLLLDAVDRLIATGRSRRFGALIFLCIVMNCYTAWPLCLFCFLYLLAQWLALPEKPQKKHCMALIRSFLKGLLPGAGLALACVSPVVLRYLAGDAFRFSGPPKTVSFGVPDVLYCLFFGRYTLASASAGLPYVYSGMGVFALAFLVFFGSKPSRGKFAGAALLGLTSLSYLVELPGLTWSNGTDVTVFPFRYGFIFSVLVLYTAAEVLVRGGPEFTSILASWVPGAILLIGYRFNAGGAYTRGRMLAVLLFYLGSCVCLWIRDHRPAWRRAASAALALMMLADVYASSSITLYGVLQL